jgi:hypothetical protein
MIILAWDSGPFIRGAGGKNVGPIPSDGSSERPRSFSDIRRYVSASIGTGEELKLL